MEETKVPLESLLFVTTPIDSFANRCLVVVGSVSPDRTTIFSVDKKLEVELLYDSVLKNDLKNKDQMLSFGGTDKMYSVVNVRVLQTGIFLVEERIDSGALPFAKNEGRKFIIDVTKGTFELLMNIDGTR